MATQTLEFNGTSGLTLTAKLFAVGSDTQVASVSATEATNRKNRYRAAFTDVAAGAYTLIAFVGATGGFANEVYDLTLTTATFYPRSEASVNAEVLDVLTVDTFAELASPPAATSSLKDKLTWLFMWARNRSTQTATQRKLYADDATTVVSTEVVSDDTITYDKGEAA